MDKQKLIKQLFVGKVSDILGFEKTAKLLKEATDAINAMDEVSENLNIPDMGTTPYEKWENLKKYILIQTEIIDKETPWQNSEPEWWVEMQNIERKIRNTKR